MGVKIMIDSSAYDWTGGDGGARVVEVETLRPSFFVTIYVAL